MKRARMLELAEQAGFVMWSKDSDWKPEGATIDWSCDYDKELRKFTKLVEAEYERMANRPDRANLCGCCCRAGAKR
jgi:hypothetical protein